MVGNVFHAAISVATIPDSYADSYASKKRLNKVELADSQKDYFDYRYETYQYDFNGDGTITLIKYCGVSEELVIPSEIKGETVAYIGEDFFDSAKTVRDLYIPLYLLDILIEDETSIPDVTIHCYDVSYFYMGNPNTKFNIELMNHSEYVNYELGDCPYSYNDKGNSIEITGYSGEEKELLIIPSYINGKPVRIVNFDMLGLVDAVVFPETVTDIKGRTSITTVSVLWVFCVFFVVVAFLANMITMNIVCRCSRIGELHWGKSIISQSDQSGILSIWMSRN